MGDAPREHDSHPSDTGPQPLDIEAFRAVQASAPYVALRRRHRQFVLPVTAACLLWYLAYVLVAGYAPQVFAITVSGSINLGMVWGLAQVVTTFAVTMTYVWYANKHLDPAAAEIRAQLETGAASTATTAEVTA
ncbi:MAG: DUF485 domain-containing protein [Microcella sp.]